MNDTPLQPETLSAQPGAATQPFPEGTPQARDYDDLVAWRDALVLEDDDESSRPGDSALRRIVSITSTGVRSAEDLALRLSADLRPFAKAIAENLDRPQASPPAGPPPKTPPPALPPIASTYTEPPVPDTGLALEQSAFAAYDFSKREREPTAIALHPEPGGAVRLTWSPCDDDRNAAVQIYRVIANDNEPLWSPDRGTQVAAVTELSALDDRPVTSAQRFYQVWCNAGTAIDTARSAQPRRHAEAIFVSPVRDFELLEDSGRVIGQWGVWPGAQRVHVFRIPIEVGAHGTGDPRYRILPEEQNLGGFVDAHAERGKRYLYSAMVEVESDGVSRMSAPTGRDAFVSVVLQPVTDLAIAQNASEEDPAFDLTWTPPPAGRVVVYRTAEAPTAGIEDREQAESALEMAKLLPNQRLYHPISAMPDGQEGMRSVPWITDSAMAYFTPVTVLDGNAFVGMWQSSVRIGGIQDAILRERVDGQVLTFSWPQGADSVFVYVSALGAPTDAALESQPHEISATTYSEQGGFRFPQALPAERGCTVHLIPSAFQRGTRHLGSSARVDYHGLLKIWYTVDLSQGRGRPQSVAITLSADRELQVSPPFALICCPDRLPLHIGDGVALQVRSTGDEMVQPTARLLPRTLGPRPQGQGWVAELGPEASQSPGRTLYIRLFADLPPERLQHVAVIDPPVSQLRLQ
jgi:hypothetical protein